MDQERFDELTRNLSSSQTRRGMLRKLVGTAVGGALAVAGVRDAAAKGPGSGKGPCKAPNFACGKGKNALCCGPNEVCNGSACVPAGDPCAGITCNTGNECATDYCDNGSCYSSANTGAPCAGGNGTCDSSGYCQQNDPCAGVNCDTGNECLIGYCSGGGCYTYANDGGSCNGDGICDSSGTCRVGTCVGFFQTCVPGVDTCCDQVTAAAGCFTYVDCPNGGYCC